MTNQFAAPILLNEQNSVVLERMPLGGDESGKYSEAWLQSLLFSHPNSLPINEIDQTYKNLVPICRELNTPVGPIDVMYATPEGNLIVLEAKLWRNPESRRKVIGQILDYAKELGRWSYDDLQREVSRATRNQFGAAKDFFKIVSAAYPDIVESEFVDSVTRKLKRGEFLLLIVGDGIREEISAITEFLENHATLHFTFGLVEMALYKLDSSLLVLPRVIVKTVIVKRTVVTLASENLVAKDADTVDIEPSTDITELQNFYLGFWQEFLACLKLDDQSQKTPLPSRRGEIRFYLSGNNAWITVFFIQQEKTFGIFLGITKEAIGELIYSRLKEDCDEINNSLGIPVKWDDANGKNGWGAVFVNNTAPDLRAPEYRNSIKEYLSDNLNRFVNTFKPRIERIVSEI